MNVAEWLNRVAVAAPERPAIFHGMDPWCNYRDFATKARALAGALGQMGVQPGEPVGVFMKNVPDYLPVLYGIWWSGAAAIPINAKLHPREAEWIIGNSGARIVFASDAFADDLTPDGGKVISTASTQFAAMFDADGPDKPVTRDPGDLAWLFYTSGTTGRPKGVQITHGMLQAMTLSYLADVDEVYAKDHAIYAAPLSHAAGIYNFMHVLRGAGHVVPRSGGFEPSEIFELARHFRQCHLFAAPTMVHRMTAEAKSTGSTGEGLRSVVYAGGPMYNADIIEAVDHFGPIFLQVYGQGECPMSITALSRHDVTDRTHPRWRDRLASVGKAQSVVEVMIGDEEGNELPRGETGEIMVRGATVMPGYWKNPEATAKTIVKGWLLTGDMGRMDDDGYVTMVDRSKDLIISGGSNIYPREVEEVLLTHDTVSEVSVVGKPDPEWGEVVVAFVVGQGDAAALDQHCLNNIARFKRPKEYRFVDALPKNNYGKVLKTELREALKTD